MKNDSNALEASPFMILHRHLDISPDIIRKFLIFLLRKKIYHPYVGRLSDSDYYKNRFRCGCPPEEIINNSFLWMEEAFLHDPNIVFKIPSVVLNNDKKLEWIEYHNEWKDFCEKNNVRHSGKKFV